MSTPQRPGELPVENPADESIIEVVQLAGRGAVEDAVRVAKKAFGEWRRDEQNRRTALSAIAAAIRTNSENLAETLTLEQGKPLKNARIEVERTAFWFDHYADLPLTTEIPGVKGAEVKVTRRPLGAVTGITASNYPLLLAAWKLAPALLGGNVILLKPSPSTPLATLEMGQLIDGCVPAGVVQVLVGDAELGRALVDHEDVHLVSFTGSPAVGWSIASLVAGRRRIVLELGGNDPAVILSDADVEKAAPSLFAAAFLNNGQACIAIKRVYAPHHLVPRLTDALAELAGSAVVGDGMDPSTTHGPLVSRAQRDRVATLVDDARARGAKVVAGGFVPRSRGHFYHPTVLGGATDEMPIVSEEQFGPALPIVGYSDLESVVRVINSGPYGLGGSVWGDDLDRAATVAQHLDCGVRWVNAHGRQEPTIPFGGHRLSGAGVENGNWGLDAYCELAVDFVNLPT